MIDYIKINKEAWNNRVEVHLKSNFYQLDEFKKGKSSLPDLDVKLLGDVKGKSVLHLQCHFGMDSLSIARMGAKVTGVDFSDVAIKEARILSDEIGVKADFVCCDVLDLEEHLHQKFDIVYTSYGTIGWFPDLERWGKMVSSMLKPGGRFVMVDFHPILWMLDEQFEKIKYAYSQSEPIIENEPTYTDNGEEAVAETVGWNHGLSALINTLAQHDIFIKRFDEYYYSPYNLSKKMVETKPSQYKLIEMEDIIPLTYSVEGLKM